MYFAASFWKRKVNQVYNSILQAIQWGLVNNSQSIHPTINPFTYLESACETTQHTEVSLTGAH